MYYNMYMGFLNNFNDILNNWLSNAGIWGGIVCCMLIIIEPLLPFLPMFLFVTLNLYIFGYVLGFILSYICSVLGCGLFYFVVRKLLINKATKFYKDKEKINSLVTRYKNIKLETLTTIISMPFTPSVMINLFAAISGMSFKKYITAEIIAKIFITIFWGFIGVNLIKCFENPKYLLIILLMLLVGYILSKLINKKYKLDD